MREYCRLNLKVSLSAENSSSLVVSVESFRSAQMMSFRKAGYAVLLEDRQAHCEEDERGVLKGNHVDTQQGYAQENGTVANGPGDGAGI
jgi:hypothetical protein